MGDLYLSVTHAFCKWFTSQGRISIFEVISDGLILPRMPSLGCAGCWRGWQPPTAHVGVPSRGRCWQHNVVVQGSLALNWCKGKILYNITTGQVYNNLSKSSGVKQAPSKPILHRDRGRGLGWWLVALSPANPNTPLLAVDLDHGLGLMYVYNYVIDFSSLCSKSHLWYRDIWTPYSWFQGWKASEKIPNTLYFTMFKFRFIFSVCEYKLHALSDLSDNN